MMDAPNAYVIDPNGFVYKCISRVGREEYSIGHVGNGFGFDADAHKKVTPFDSESCKTCKYFPICKGGCLMNNMGVDKECNIWKFMTEELIWTTLI